MSAARWNRSQVLVVAGCTIAAVSMALPWAASGDRWRSAYALVRLARELEVARGALANAFGVAVVLAPMLAAGTWAAAAFRMTHLVRGLGGLVAILTLTTAYGVAVSPLRSGAGLVIGVGASLATLLGVGTLRRR